MKIRLARPAVLFAVLAFVVSLFGMGVAGPSHEVGFSVHQMAMGECSSDHSHDHDATVDNHGCETPHPGTCHSGPSCCSNTCQAVILAAVLPTKQHVHAVTAVALDLRDSSGRLIALERPPRVSLAA